MYAHLDAELEKLENDIRHTGARYELAEHKMSTIGSPPRTRTCEPQLFLYHHPKHQGMAKQLVEKTSWLKASQKCPEELASNLWN